MNETGSHSRLAILVHELRSPVAALAAITDAIGCGDLDRGAQSELLRLAIASCDAIERIAADASATSLRRAPVAVGQLLHDISAEAELRGLHVRVVVPNDLPDVAADAVRLRQALDNLVTNGLAHSSEGEDVVLTANATTDELRLTVSDQGPGIAPEDQERVFEPGVRLHSGYRGSGLGLTIARAIAEAHGGRLTVDSSPGAGAVFTIALPLPPAR